MEWNVPPGQDEDAELEICPVHVSVSFELVHLTCPSSERKIRASKNVLMVQANDDKH